jgi:hypothetical protein
VAAAFDSALVIHYLIRSNLKLCSSITLPDGRMLRIIILLLWRNAFWLDSLYCAPKLPRATERIAASSTASTTCSLAYGSRTSLLLAEVLAPCSAVRSICLRRWSRC